MKNYSILSVRTRILLCICAAFIMNGCNKFVEVQSPVTQVTGDNVYNSDATATAVLTGLYIQMSSASYLSITQLPSLSSMAGLSADELTLMPGAENSSFAINQQQFYYYTNALSATAVSQYGSELWPNFYNSIYTCNAVVEGVNNSSHLTPNVKQQLLGEAKFMRALFYFYLVNLYGDVPLVIGTDYQTNGALPRASKTLVYQQIISDLLEAKEQLSNNYLDATLSKTTIERVRPTKWAAIALLSRVYLYSEKWSDAETMSTAVINNTSLFNIVSLDKTFLQNSREAIWQLQPVNAGWNTEDARLFILPSTGPNINTNNTVYVSSGLLNSFEADDQRKNNWINSVTADGVTYYYPAKYKAAALGDPVTEYLMIFRLGEQYLIRAEARAHLGSLVGSNSAASDIDTIRVRAGLLPITSTTQPTLLTAVQHERQVELFTELGHRWLDLKRTGKIDEVMNLVTPIKANGAAWKTYQQLYPLPYTDVIRTNSLIQNTGYTK